MAVAVKVIRPETLADPAVAQDIERRFKGELLLARQFTHKNVVRIHDIGVANRIGLWIGCMLETGIGQARKIELASLPGCNLPADMAPSNRYYVEDVVEPEITLTPRSTIAVSNAVGGSHRPIEARIAKYTQRRFAL